MDSYCQVGKSPIAPNPLARSQSTILYCQFRRHLIEKYAVHARAARYLVTANALNCKANLLSIAAYENRREDWRQEALALRAEAVEYLTRAMRLRAQVPD